MADADHLHSFSFGAFGGVPCAQIWADLMLWEWVLNGRDGMFVSITELGTFRGGFSLYLRAQAEARGLKFDTYDSVTPDPLHPLLRDHFRKRDIFRCRDEIIERIHEHGGATVLFCDNGNKPRELREFTQGLPPGSVVIVHDWGTETLPEDVPEWLEEIHGDFCDAIGSISRAFKARG